VVERERQVAEEDGHGLSQVTVSCVVVTEIKVPDTESATVAHRHRSSSANDEVPRHRYLLAPIRIRLSWAKHERQPGRFLGQNRQPQHAT
jgi:hypothetical protein